jgi:hypothetical protein
MKQERPDLSNVKVKSMVWNLLPWLGRETTCTALYPNVYVPPWFFEELTSGTPDPYFEAIVIHEQTHIEREIQKGWFVWLALYLLSAKFRVDEELVADRELMRYLKERGVAFDLAKRAKQLSSWLYLRPISEGEAFDRLEEIWNSL